MSDVPNVMIAIPNTDWIHRGVFQSVVEVIAASKYPLQIQTPAKKCNEVNYMHIAKTFWESDCEFLLHVDSDNPPTANPLELIPLDKDIISMPTPIWWYDKPAGGDQHYRPFHWNVYDYMAETNDYRSCDPRPSGLQRIDATGAGCLLIHRRVFNDHALMRKEAFHRKWTRDDGQQKRGLDLAFSERLKKCGLELWCSWDHKCHHFKELDLLNVFRGFKEWLYSVVESMGGTVTLEDILKKVPQEEIMAKAVEYEKV